MYQLYKGPNPLATFVPKDASELPYSNGVSVYDKLEDWQGGGSYNIRNGTGTWNLTKNLNDYKTAILSVIYGGSTRFTLIIPIGLLDGAMPDFMIGTARTYAKVDRVTGDSTKLNVSLASTEIGGSSDILLQLYLRKL